MKDILLPILLTIASGYLLGSINSAIIVSRLLKREDIRKHGSGNAGATNMYRVYGKIPAVITIFGDFLKAALAVLLARFIFSAFASSLGYDSGYLAGLFVLVGHILPVYFRFKGGKGVMPLIGVLIFVNLPVFALVAAFSAAVVLISRTMSLGSVVGTILLPFITYGIAVYMRQEPVAITLYAVAYAILVLVSHRSNIKRLLSSTENPISPKSP